MSDLKKAAQQALEALGFSCPAPHLMSKHDAAITALRAALEQEQEADYPEEKLQSVAEYVSNQYHVWYGVAARDIEEVLRQSVSCGLVNNPPRREWVSLTEEEIRELSFHNQQTLWPRPDRSDVRATAIPFARAIEAALKERNT
jgi:hypothetical protein